MAIIKGKHIIELLLIYILFISCNKNREDQIIFFYPDPFSEVEINDAFVVYLSEGEEYEVEIRGDKKIIESVEVMVEEEVLKISNTQNLKWATPRKNKVEIYITAPPLELVVLKETCDLSTLTPITSEEFGLIMMSKANEAHLNLNANTFYYWNNFPCGGKLTLTGQIENLKIWNFAIMSVDAKDLVTSYAWVSNEANGDCEVNVSDKLEYSINGLGDIVLYGSPSEIINLYSEGPGTLVEHN